MNVTIIDSLGKVMQRITLSDTNYSGCVVPPGATLIGMHAERLSDYWDGDAFIDVGTPPSDAHVFDYASKSWVLAINLEQLQDRQWRSVLRAAQLSTATISFRGAAYDADSAAQLALLNARMAGAGAAWTSADNTQVQLSAADIEALHSAVVLQSQSAHARAQSLRALIYAATTPAAVTDIQF